MGETIRVEHSKDYTVISNAAIRDTRLSFKSRGLHHLLLSYPNGWQINIEHLSEQSDKDGKDAVASALKELETVGYLIRTQIRVKGKIVGYESTIRELPIENPPQPKGRRSKKKQDSPQPDFPDTVKPDRENPQLEKPEPENPVINKYVLDQLSKEEVSIPPTPQGEETSESEFSKPENQLTDTLDKKTEIRNSPITPPGDIKIAAPPLNHTDNSFVSGRPQNAFKNCGVSVASDPWMLTAKNPHQEFAQWVADKRYLDKSKTPLADAKAEIRNNSDRASDLWDEYQSEMTAKAQKIAAIEQIPQKPINPAPQAENQAEKYAFVNNPDFQNRVAAMKARLLEREEQEKAAKSRKRPCKTP